MGSGLPADHDLALGLAEAHLEAGHSDKAIAMCASVAQRANLDAVSVAKCRRVEATVALDRGDRDSGLAELAAAASLAEYAGNSQEAARSALRLFTALHSSGGSSSSSETLTLAKRLALRSGDKTLMADLHMRVGQAEAQNGNVHAGRRHLERSIELLEESPHASLAARSRLALSSCLALLCRNIRARHVAREALTFAESAGSVFVTRLCKANLAQLQYRTGSIRNAIRHCDELLGIEDLSPVLRLAVLETYGAAYLELDPESLASSQMVSEFLGRMRSTSEPSWTAVEAVPTQARLLGKLEGLAEARRALSLGRQMSQRRSHGDNVCRLWFVEAELCAVLGDLEDSEVCLGEASRVLGSSLSLEMSAFLERTRGLIALRIGATTAASGHFGRAERTFGSAGLFTESRRTRALGGSLSRPLRNGGSVTLRRRCSLLFHVTAASFLGSLAAHPRLLANELTRYVTRSRIATRAEVVESTSRQAQPRLSADDYRVTCGNEGDALVSIDVEPSRNHVARQQLHALQVAVETAVEAEATKSAAAVFGSFFELETANEATHGLYVAPVMRPLLKQLKQVAKTELSVLITGETGTGKDVVANDLHKLSMRSTRPFIAFNVAAVPRDMLEGQLFGHRRGAYTGAVNDSKGLIREADGGTLFIDEIGDLSIDLQPKLLRFLESGEIQPLGERPQRVDVRVVVATNAKLDSLVKEGKLREDLFYRLNVITITLPSLRERREEIPTLVRHFLSRHAGQAAKPIPQITARALELLTAYEWPGNVRQLNNELRRLVALSEEGEAIDIGDISTIIRDKTGVQEATSSDGSTVTLHLDRELQDLYEELERAAITRAMIVSRQNQAESARRLGITRKGLYLKRKRLGLADDATADDEPSDRLDE